MKPKRCEECELDFFSPATLRRHREAFHQESRTQFQGWSCTKIFARKETVLSHSRKTHNDTDGKFVIVTTTNKRYHPDIQKPAKWIPPAEARTRADQRPTIYQITIPKRPRLEPVPTTSDPQPIPSTPTTGLTIPEIVITPASPEWHPFSLNELSKIYPVSMEELMLELVVTDSESDSSISSQSTDCQDEVEATEETHNSCSIYGIFNL